jgi:hypothetical protein
LELGPHGHGVNGQLAALYGRHDDHFEKVPGLVGADDEPTVGVGAGIFDSKGMVDGVEGML